MATKPARTKPPTSTKDVWIKAIGEHRGAPRVYLDAAQAARAGFTPGERFTVEVDGQRVTVSKHPDGARTVSRRRRGDQDLPVIDINSGELLAAFKGMDAVRVVVSEDRIYLLPLASEIKKRERFDRLVGKLQAKEPLSIGSLSHGGGVLSHAIHEGLQRAGLEPRLEFVNEIRDDLIEYAMKANDAWSAWETGRTAAIVAPMQEVAQDEWLLDQLPKLEILEAGIPCSGASRAGATKNDLAKMEDHPLVGHLVYSALVIINKVQPAVVLIENVVQYSDSASAQILRQQLRDMGYRTHEAVLEGKDFGVMENRVRWCLVATTAGVDFDFDQLRPRLHVVKRVADHVDASIGPNDERWRTFAHLKDKAGRDRAAGKGFKMQTVTLDDTSVPTLRKGYHKGGSTDPLLEHPTNPDLLRLFTVQEHARLKGVPEHLVPGNHAPGSGSETMGHQLLGQGIVYEPFAELGRRLGLSLQRLLDEREQVTDIDAEDADVRRRRERNVG
jgi:DNA (cytosine-5)-methyltransferase 1